MLALLVLARLDLLPLLLLDDLAVRASLILLLLYRLFRLIRLVQGQVLWDRVAQF